MILYPPTHPPAHNFFFVGLGFELRASFLHSRHFTTWTTSAVHFAMVILEMGGLTNYFLSGLALNHDLLNQSLPSS
jgi:hypothetical protein